MPVRPLLAALLCLCPLAAHAQEVLPEQVTLDTRAPGTPFPHFWEQMFGSGRAVLALRSDYRQDLATVHAATGFRYVRFHAILHDEVGVYEEDKQGNPVYNWSYVDQIYDGLLAQGVRPFVEISFTPKALASDPKAIHPFWYKQNVSPPKDYAKWDALITAFAKHLIDRYGINEVASWYFEVWNEPNIDFWAGRPQQATYFELYDHTARAVKAADQRLRVGGPATAQAAWVGDTIAHAVAHHIPLDFVSTHVYGNDVAADVFPKDKFPTPPEVAPHQMVPAALQKVHEEIVHSPMPHIPLIWSEFNATYANEQPITDSTYIGPWMADTIRQCDGLVDMMSYWDFSDVFEEQGVVKTPFYGGYGLVAERGIPKPAFLAFSLLHTLGDTRLPTPAKDMLVTRRADGTLVLAAWSLVEPPGSRAAAKEITLTLPDLPKKARATVRRVDGEHGDTLGAWKQLGSPAYPSLQQIAQLKKVGTLGDPELLPIKNGRLTLRLPSSGLAVVEIQP